MKYLLVLIPLILLLTSCDEILNGTFDLTKDLSLLNKKGVEIKLIPNKYDASIALDTKNKEAILTIKVEDTIFGKKEDFVFKLPANFPTSQGDFTVSSDESGQNIDLKGNIKRDKTESQQYYSYENCIKYYEHYQHCDQDSSGHTQCHTYERPVYGTEQVYFHYHYYITLLIAQFLGVNSSEVVANLEAKHVIADKIINYSGPCL